MEIEKSRKDSLSYEHIVLYCIDGEVIAVLMHYDLFEIYCAPPNLGITRT